MYYYANFDRADDGISVTFRDIPEAITCGQTDSEALEMAEDALLTCVEIYFDEDRPFPLASKQQKGEIAVYLPETVYAKVLLHNVMLEKGVNKADLARTIDAKPPEIQRILRPRHKTKIDTIGHALSALGKPLQLSV